MVTTLNYSPARLSSANSNSILTKYTIYVNIKYMAEQFPQPEITDALHPIDYEVLRFGLIRDEQARQLEDAGLTEKTLDLFRGNDIYRRNHDQAPAVLSLDALSENPDFSVGVFRDYRNRGTPAEHISYGVRVELIESKEHGYQTRSRKALVGQKMLGLLLPRGDFEQVDLELIIGMVEALELEQQVGELPHLERGSLSHISDPRKMLQKLSAVQQLSPGASS